MAIIDEIYPDYPTALAACGSGYDDIDIAEVVAFKAVQAIDAGTAVPEQALNSIVAVGIAAADVVTGHSLFSILVAVADFIIFKSLEQRERRCDGQ